MRRRIRLTGRRQLSKGDFDIRLPEVGGKRLLTVVLADPKALSAFPADAEVSIRLFENKRVEVVRLGTVGKLATSRELKNADFVAPSCRVRVAVANGHGLLLASTDDWTLRGEGDEDLESRRGIIQFLPADTAPQVWKLEFPGNDHPIIKVDKNIPHASKWARNDPVFVSCVLPAVVGAVFGQILAEETEPEGDWMADWVKWAKVLLPEAPPPFGSDEAERADYTNRLIDSFCYRHSLADQLFKDLKAKEEQ